MVGTDRRSRARAAIQAAATDQNLPTDLTILSERWNTVALLGNSNVVARAGTLADLARENPADAFEREVDVCSQLVLLGAPVQEPLGRVHMVDGIPISFWRAVPGEMGTASEKAMVESLSVIHRLGKDISLDQPWFATVAEAIPTDIRRLVDDFTIEAPLARILDGYFQRNLEAVVSANLPGGLIHGDAQRKNAMADGENSVWIDFEDCCIGPHAWDLACLTKNPHFSVERVLDAYAGFSGEDRIPSRIIQNLWALRDLEALTWMLLIQDERELEFRQNAQELLNQILEQANDG